MSEKDEYFTHLNFFDGYEINDDRLLSEVARLFSRKYNTSVLFAVSVVRESYLTKIILDYPEQVHHDDIHKLVDNVYREKFK